MNKQKVLNSTFGALSILVVIASTILTFSEHPIALAVNKLQMQLSYSYSYYPALTICLLALLPLIALLLLKVMIVLVHNKVYFKDKPDQHLKFYR